MNKTGSATQETGNHLEVFLYRVPKKNQDAVAQNLRKFVPWFQRNGVGVEYYQFSESETMEGMESIVKTVSAADDEDIWIELQYFRDRKHYEDVYTKMMQDNSLKQLGDEFFGLVTQGKNVVSGEFSRLRE
jgi:uncharacterized protein YbaA (DUF1428 family)